LSKCRQALSPVNTDAGKLRINIKDSSEDRRGRRKRRRAYLDGRATDLHPNTHDSPEYLSVLEAENRSWLATLETAFSRGNAFAVISESDLLSDTGILRALESRGMKIERALKGYRSSLHLEAPQFLRTDECFDAMKHIFQIASPESADVFEKPDVMRQIALTGQGRSLVSVCSSQTTPWFDCVTDA